jgi:hypothetical protein
MDVLTGNVSDGETVQCVHCGGHFFIGPGYTKGRGFCMNCNGFICGERCQECVPWEKALEIAEGTRNPTAVSIAVPTSAPKQLLLPWGKND